MLIDCHVHLNNYHQDRHPPTRENLERLRGQMAKWKFDMCLVLTSYLVNEDRPSAATVVDLIGDDPHLKVVEGVGVTGGAVDWEGIAQRLREKKTVGLKFYPGYEHAYVSDRAFLPGIELAAKYRVPVMVHTGDTYSPRAKLKFAHPLHVDDVAVDHPDVDFIICHVGNPWFRETAEIIYKNHNVHADISGLTLEAFSAPLEAQMAEELREILVFTGDADSLLFGTDWPLVRQGPYLRFVDKIGLEPDVREKLLWKNTARIFKLKMPTREAASVPTHDPKPTPRPRGSNQDKGRRI